MSDKLDLSGVRREYKVAGLDRDNLNTNPFEQFNLWIEQALAADPSEATSMTLATAGADGFPSARIVLLKDYGPEGYTWFTNYGSEKGRELAENARAELLFYWPKQERQVRIRGNVAKVSRAETEAYFAVRPLGSQIGACASLQSQPIEAREELEARVESLTSEFKDTQVPCPENWGGYRLTPERFEFWQGRESRLHDRFRFVKTDTGWEITRLQP